MVTDFQLPDAVAPETASTSAIRKIARLNPSTKFVTSITMPTTKSTRHKSRVRPPPYSAAALSALFSSRKYVAEKSTSPYFSASCSAAVRFCS